MGQRRKRQEWKTTGSRPTQQTRHLGRFSRRIPRRPHGATHFQRGISLRVGYHTIPHEEGNLFTRRSSCRSLTHSSTIIYQSFFRDRPSRLPHFPVRIEPRSTHQTNPCRTRPSLLGRGNRQNVGEGNTLEPV